MSGTEVTVGISTEAGRKISERAVVVEPEVKRNERDHSSGANAVVCSKKKKGDKKFEEKTKKVLDRADIVRDFRFARLVVHNLSVIYWSAGT